MSADKELLREIVAMEGGVPSRAVSPGRTGWRGSWEVLRELEEVRGVCKVGEWPMPSWGEVFLAAYRETGNPTEALKRAGVVLRKVWGKDACGPGVADWRTASVWRKNSEELDEAWRAVKEEWIDRVESRALRLASEGSVKRRYGKNGEVTHEDEVPHERLMEFVLERGRRKEWGRQVSAEAGKVVEGILIVLPSEVAPAEEEDDVRVVEMEAPERIEGPDVHPKEEEEGAS